MSDPDPGPSLLIKYGGNAMTDPETRDRVLAEIADLRDDGVRMVLVHGGGPAIAIEGGVDRARIVDGTRLGSLREAIEGDPDRGTEISA